MEQNLVVISKRIWKIMRVAMFMIRKGLCKKKILMDLNMMMKRGKIAGKALGNLTFHNHHHRHKIHHLFTQRGGVNEPSNLTKGANREYEFSCSSNTPLYQHYFTNKRKNHQNKALYFMPSPLPIEEADDINLEDVNNMLEMMLLGGKGIGNCLSAASPAPALIGFGWSPAARQVRITDSPFPVHYVEGDKHVDQAAEDFIKNFYSQLKQQN